MKSKRKLNYKKAVQKAFKDTAQAYNEANQTVFTEPRDWSGNWGVTKRKNGEVVFGSYRNIVDQSNLKDSQTMTFPDQLTAQYEWNGNGETPATVVYFGAVLNNGGVIPGRAWTEEALEKVDLPQTFIESFNKNLK